VKESVKEGDRGKQEKILTSGEKEDTDKEGNSREELD